MRTRTDDRIFITLSSVSPQVFEGNGKKSPGALTKVTKKGRVDRTTLKKEDLTMNTAMKVVSKKVSNFHKSSLQGKKIVLWGQCLSKARMQLGIKGFKVGCAVLWGVVLRFETF